MDDPIDNPMKGGRVRPFDDTSFSDDARGGNESETAANGPSPLTHRPRGLATLSASTKPTGATRTAARLGSVNPAAHDAGVSPNASTGQAPDLRPFADQLVAIADKLRAGDFPSAPLAGSNYEHAPHKTHAAGAGSSSAAGSHDLNDEARRKTFAEMARLSYAKRRKRATIFGDPELFGEPGWDILLDLYIAQAEEKSVSVSSACIGSAAPPTTGLRWRGVLAEQDLVTREHDPHDQRRVLVRLTEKALDAMDRYFSSSAGLHVDRRSARA